jgi:prenyl protein peptidase
VWVLIQGPISEELVWRSCLVGAYRLAGTSNAFLVFFTPVSFGSGAPPLIQKRRYKLNPIPAHLHHVWEIYNMHGGTRQALRRAIVLARE